MKPIQGRIFKIAQEYTEGFKRNYEQNKKRNRKNKKEQKGAFRVKKYMEKKSINLKTEQQIFPKCNEYFSREKKD